jgi:hypothetical protein
MVMRTIRNQLGRIAVGTALLFGGLGVGYGTMGGSAAVAQAPVEHHPHIHAALRELREARRELKEANHDFGGHRLEALKATDHAIRQLEKALQYDRK